MTDNNAVQAGHITITEVRILLRTTIRIYRKVLAQINTIISSLFTGAIGGPSSWAICVRDSYHQPLLYSHAFHADSRNGNASKLLSSI